MDDHVAERHRRPSARGRQKIMRFSQRKMMSRAVVSTVAGVEARELRRLVGPAERRERPERRREPRVEDVLARAVSSAEPHSAHASGSVSATVTCPSGQYQTGSWWPHQIWREMFQSRSVLQPVERRRVLATPGGSGRARLDRGDRGRCELAPSRSHHCSEMSGSMRLLAALAVADGVPVVLALLELVRARAAHVERRARRPPPASARRARRRRRSCSPSGPITVSSGRSWSRPISKSSRVVAGRDLERAGAEVRARRARRR